RTSLAHLLVGVLAHTQLRPSRGRVVQQEASPLTLLGVEGLQALGPRGDETILLVGIAAQGLDPQTHPVHVAAGEVSGQPAFVTVDELTVPRLHAQLISIAL